MNVYSRCGSYGSILACSKNENQDLSAIQPRPMREKTDLAYANKFQPSTSTKISYRSAPLDVCIHGHLHHACE